MRTLRVHSGACTLRATAAIALAVGMLTSTARAEDDTVNADPIQLLKLDGMSGGALSALSTCSPAVLKGQYSDSVQQSLNPKFARIDAMMAKKDYLSAIGEGKTDASIFSYCYRKYGKDADAPIYAAGVGHFLTVAVVASRNAQLESPEMLESRKRAKVLLTYAKGGGQDVVADLASLEQMEPKKDEVVTAGEFARTAREFVGGYQANALAFEKSYLGKTLQITGPTRTITPSPDGAMLVLTGVQKSNDHIMQRDEVTCWIKDKSALDKAAQIAIPAEVTIAGKYEHVGFGAGIQLTGCTVVDLNPKKTAAPK